MKYESTILKRLIDTYGVVGNPRYISEIIKEFIVRGKECFPNLFTYQADWLAHIDEFGLNPTYTVSYTGQSIYAPNTLERPVKSAILKGNTLVNLCKTPSTFVTMSSSLTTINLNIAHNLQANKKYAVIGEISEINAPNNGLCTWVINADGTEAFEAKRVTNKGRFFFTYNATKEIKSFRVYIHGADRDNGGTITIGNLMIIEYQEGMENWDIPYFTGMQSVKTPVLTTSNEDGTKTNSLSCNEDIELKSFEDLRDELNLLTGEMTQRVEKIVLDGSEDGWIYNGKGSTTAICYIENYFTTPPTTAITNYFSLIETRPGVFWNAGQDHEMFCVNDTSLAFRIEKTKLKTLDSNGIKEWLSQNPITIQYQLATESIKTVDLTILDQNGQSVDYLKSFNGGTHVYTSSLEGSLVPSVDISVVTNLEETLKICSLEGNTM